MGVLKLSVMIREGEGLSLSPSLSLFLSPSLSLTQGEGLILATKLEGPEPCLKVERELL